MNHQPIFTRLLLISLLCLTALSFTKAQSCQRFSFIYTPDNNNVCVGDGVPDVVRLFSNARGRYVYLITDEKGLILTSVTTGNSFDFEKAGVGICRVYGVSLGAEDQLRGDIVGKAVRATKLSDGCFFVSKNFITIFRSEAPNGGRVQMPNGLTTRYTCPGDRKADVVRFDSVGTKGNQYRYIITDDKNNILATPGGDMADLEGAGEGICRIWGVAFNGKFLAKAGQNAAAAALATGCFDLSDNFIETIRFKPNGGRVQMPNGLTTRYTCPSDGKADVVRFDSVGASRSKYAYIITDDKNMILGLPPGDMVNLEGAGEGLCRVWGVAYTGNFTGKVGDNAATVALSDECFDLSDNFIETIRFKPNGGRVQMPNGLTTRYTCPGDGKADIVRFDSVGASRSKYAYIITDDKNMILGLPAGDMANLEGAGEGLCRVWGVAYTGNFTGKVGDNAATVALSDECFDLSDNFIETIRFKPNGGRVQMPNGLTTRYTCPGDGKADVVRFDSVGTSRSKYAYIITDDKNMILGLPAGDMANLEGAGEGLCRVWGVAYTGNFTGKVGDNAATVALSDECFDLSDNFIETIRFKPNGGRVQMPNGLTTRYTCPGDGKADIVRFDSVGASRSKYAYIITDDKNMILGLPAGDMANLEGAGEGLCRVWGVAYTGNFTGKVGDNAATVALSDECFDLSDNFIETIRFKPNGGRVQMPNGQTVRYTCPGDGKPDVVRFDSVGASRSKYAYIITDDKNMILGLPAGDMANLEGAGEGLCRVWGVAYTGNFTGKVGDNAATAALSDECFDLSDNFIETIRFKPNGGRVTTANNLTEIITIAGDKIADTIRFASTGASRSQFRYVVTDSNNVILGLPPGNVVDFEGAGVGVCRVWGLSFTGTFTLKAGDDIDLKAASDDCFAFSSNFVKVTRNAPAPLNSAPELTNFGTAARVSNGKLFATPNPFRETINLNVDWSTETTEANIIVRDLTGRVINTTRTTLYNGQNTVGIDANNWPLGVLTLTLYAKSEVISTKIVKVN